MIVSGLSIHNGDFIRHMKYEDMLFYSSYSFIKFHYHFPLQRDLGNYLLVYTGLYSVM